MIVSLMSHKPINDAIIRPLIVLVMLISIVFVIIVISVL